jgi:hypothetical protein
LIDGRLTSRSSSRELRRTTKACHSSKDGIEFNLPNVSVSSRSLESEACTRREWCPSLSHERSNGSDESLHIGETWRERHRLLLLLLGRLLLRYLGLLLGCLRLRLVLWLLLMGREAP